MATTPTEPKDKTEPVVPATEAKNSKPPESKAEPKTDIGDDLREATKDHLLGLPKAKAKPKADKEEKPDEKPAEKPAAEIKPDKPAEKPAEKVIEKPAAPALTAADVAKISAQTVAEMKKAEAKPEVKTEPIVLPDEVKKLAPVYDTLEELYPTEYPKGLAARVAAFKKTEMTYADNWETKNPGETFNAEDAEHAAFYEKNEPAIDAEHMSDARAEMRSKARYEKDIKPILDEREAEKRQRVMQPVLENKRVATAQAIYKSLNDKPDSMTQAAAQAWVESDPIGVAVAQKAQADWNPRVEAAIKIWESDVALDHANPVHQAAVAALHEMEDQFAKTPPEKGWMPLSQYLQLPPAEQAKHSAAIRDNWIEFMGQKAAAEAKENYVKAQENERTQAEYYAKKFGYVKREGKETAPDPAKAREEKPAAAHSPSLGDGSPTPPLRGTVPVGNGSTPTIIDNLLGLAQRAA